MIDTKYGLKYPMPHSVVHIVDNSEYTGALSVAVADDPSLYATIVVTGAPMGEDNRVISLTRDDILNVAFGINTVTSADRKKYGQTIDYASSLIAQGAPVRFMRVTPEDATYGFSCIVIQWRVDPTDNMMHVRFMEKPLPVELQLSRFKNTQRLNDSLVSYYKNDSVEADGYVWKQRVFMTNISAGRGSIYNYMANAINLTSQSKRPANVKYEFVTIDTRTNSVCERFYASLVNINNANRPDYIDPVNVVVNKRVQGSSIIVPYVNEAVVQEVYDEYMTHFKEMIDTTTTDEFTKNAYTAMNVNIFDILYGSYIYNGTENTKLPYYQVDMFDTDIPSLPTTNRLSTTSADLNVASPKVLYSELEKLTYGVTNADDNVHVGDLYLNTTGNSNLAPTLTIVGAINQYTGAVTSLSIPKVYPLTISGGAGTVVTEDVESVVIKTIFNDTTAAAVGSSKSLKSLVLKGTVVANDVVAYVGGNTFTLYTVSTADATTGTYELVAYDTAQIYTALDWTSHASGKSGVGNVIGTNETDSAWNRIGATVIVSDGIVMVNGNGHTETTEDRLTVVSNNPLHFGTCPSDVNITTDVVGAQYDVIAYADDTYEGTPEAIYRYTVSGVQGSLFRVAQDTTNVIPANYYSDEYGINMTSEVGGVRIAYGSTGFFDDNTISEIEFKWRYSALLVKAYRGELDPRIMSPTRVPAKYLFDGGHNTVVGQTILPYLTYSPADIINASTLFTADEKEAIMYNPDVIENITTFEDIDVKQAMYDLTIYRLYQGIPDDKRPIGPGSGLSLHLDSGVTDATTAMLINTSFSKRFDNPNVSWDIGGWVDFNTGMSYTFTKRLVDNLITHCKTYTVNKPFVGKYSTIRSDEYTSYFPDIDTTDWDLRELLYNSGGNAWIADINGNLTRRSQRTLLRDSTSSDLLQESNMRTLSQLVYLLQNKIDTYLLEYNDDGVLKTLSDDVNNMFSGWVGSYVDNLEIIFERDVNIDGGDIIVCYCNVSFRGLILRVPIIVNVNRREA